MPATVQMPPAIKRLSPWPEAFADCATEKVIAASRAFVDSAARLAAAEQDLGDARAAVDGANATDETNALRAAETGERCPAPTAPKAEKVAAATERTAAALAKLHDQAINVYVAGLIEDHDALVEAAQAQLHRQVAEIDSAIDVISDKLVGVADLRLLGEQLGPDTSDLEGKMVTFLPSRVGRLAERDPVDGPTRELLDQLRAKLTAPTFDRATW